MLRGFTHSGTRELPVDASARVGLGVTSDVCEMQLHRIKPPSPGRAGLMQHLANVIWLAHACHWVPGWDLMAIDEDPLEEKYGC
ncbi:hypothetical protein NDU88_011777 [Pleurodeles waltl]|uniref:Uncharacterized protein n=1 Tax=Pleurodeles waltl TaxID=8319 RepID=A0AAV7Q2N5_PLEWA|nr:hypothetical protein NDU88_011777 [Pleurodeles waltl]